MKLSPSFRELDELLARHGLEPAAFRLNPEQRPGPVFPPDIEEYVLPGFGSNGEPLRGADGRVLFAHIDRMRSQQATLEAALAEPEQLRRFHVTECAVIQRFQRSGRFDKFRGVYRDEGPFRVTIELADGTEHAAMAPLQVCMICLSEMDWNNYRNANAKQRKAIRSSFSRADFLAHYSKGFASKPRRTDRGGEENVYVPNHSSFARAMKTQRGLVCQVEHGGCGLDCAYEPALLDVHHRNEVRSDNRPENLAVLCKLCHSELHPHYAAVLPPAVRSKLLALQRQQGIRRLA